MLGKKLCTGGHAKNSITTIFIVYNICRASPYFFHSFLYIFQKDKESLPHCPMLDMLYFRLWRFATRVHDVPDAGTVFLVECTTLNMDLG